MKIEEIETFTRHYLRAALWSSIDADDEPLDARHCLDDIHPDTVRQAFEDCRDFQDAMKQTLVAAYAFYIDSGMTNHPDTGSPQACAGHDFWLTRNGHGAGFWDRGMGQVGEALTDWAKTYGSIDLYVGDDGKIHS